MTETALAALIALIAGLFVGFALGMEFGARRVYALWRRALDQPLEKTSQRENEIR